MLRNILLLILLLASGAMAVTDTLKTQDTEFRDNWMWSVNANWNQGGHDQWNIGEWEGGVGIFRQWFMVEFPGDVASVTACTLSYYVATSHVADDSLWFYRVLIHVEPEWEGDNVDANAQINEMAWSARAKQPLQTDSTWNTAGCNGSGTDYVNIIIASGDADTTNGTTLKAVIDSATIDSMATGELDNYGFLVVSNVEATPSSRTQIASSETGNEGAEPFVILVYTATGSAGYRGTIISVIGGN